jgi:hypothetical protein
LVSSPINRSIASSRPICIRHYRTAEQQNSRTAEQQNSRTAEQQNSRTTAQKLVSERFEEERGYVSSNSTLSTLLSGDEPLQNKLRLRK